MDHKHLARTYVVNGVIVCVDCHPKTEVGRDECHCSCHANSGKAIACRKCKVFHG